MNAPGSSETFVPVSNYKASYPTEFVVSVLLWISLWKLLIL